ncbi:hypothetical protein B7P43_G06887 [Cryptotermes secundus]|uniref:Uncharacterized protein n=1 Tax=Cryptotermes secundus TaxID=105785 RepID=A0A2J7PN41_9NEOP|nr:hypothetical protein B7P43_G06887 [Cryptotermes secundus]
MKSSWASKIRAGKILLAAVLAVHIGTFYLKPLLIPDKRMMTSDGDDDEPKKQTANL